MPTLCQLLDILVITLQIAAVTIQCIATSTCAARVHYLLPSSVPSMMTWPPVSWSLWYSSANHDDGLSDTKFVLSSAAPDPLVLALQSWAEQWQHQQ